MSNVSKHFCFLSQQGGPREGQLLPPHTCFGLPPGCLGNPPMMMGSQIHQQVFTNHPSGCVSNDVVPIGELETSAPSSSDDNRTPPPMHSSTFPTETHRVPYCYFAQISLDQKKINGKTKAFSLSNFSETSEQYYET